VQANSLTTIFLDDEQIRQPICQNGIQCYHLRHLQRWQTSIVQDSDDGHDVHNTVFFDSTQSASAAPRGAGNPHRFPERAVAAACASDWTLTGTPGPMVELTDARRR